VYRLTGDLASVDLTIPDPVPTTTLPPTLPPTTAPDTSVDATLQTPPDSTVDTPPDSSVDTTTTTVPPPPPPPPIPLSVEVTNYPPLVASAEVADLIGGDVDRDAFDDVLGNAVDGVQIVDVRSTIVLADDGSATLTLDVPTDVDNSVEERLKFDRAGLYPIRTEILTGAAGRETVLATHGTVVQRLPDRDEPATVSPPINLTIVSALAAADQDTTAADEQAAVEAFDEMVDTAAAVSSPLTLQIPPAIVAAEAATAAGRERLEESLAGDEFVAGPAMPLDVSSAAAVDKGDRFARELDEGEALLTTAAPTTPARRTPWIATVPLSGAGAQQLADLGFGYLVMTEQLYADTVAGDTARGDRPATDLFVDALLPGGGTLPLIVLDPLSQELTRVATDRILATSTAAEWSVQVVTEMLLAQADDRPELRRSRVLSAPDLLAPDARLLIGLETLVSTTPSIEFGDAATLERRTDVQTRSGRPVQVELPAVAGPSLADRVPLIDATALSAASAASMLPADDPRTTAWADELDAMISTALSDDEVVAATTTIQTDVDSIRSSIVAPAPFSFTLTGHSGDVELQIGNTSDDSLTVILRAASAKLSFPGSEAPTVGPRDADAGDQIVTLEPNDETTVIVPVRAKSNGTSPITIQLLTPLGETIGDPVTVTATVTAFTGLGFVLTGGLVLVLLSWWATHWRSRRRAALNEVRERHPSGAQ
jgi:hypothetical protein